MAQLIPRTGGRTDLRFQWQNSSVTRALGVVSESKAKALQKRVEARLSDIKHGILQVPEGAEIAEFVLTGRVSKKEQRPGLTFQQVKESYLQLEKARIAESSFTTLHVHLNNFEKSLGKMTGQPVASITPKEVEDFMLARLAKVRKTTLAKELKSLRHFFKYAVTHKLISENPVNIPRFKNPDQPPRFLTKAEIDRKLERGGLSEKETQELHRFRWLPEDEMSGLLNQVKADPWLSPIIHTLTYTGMRRGEVCRLEWDDVDLEAGVLLAKSRKQSTTEAVTVREIDIHPTLRTILKEHQKAASGRYVFTDEAGNRVDPSLLWQRFQNLVQGTDFEGIGLHALRHSFASNLASKGIDQRVIDSFMGHQTPAMRARYQHLFPASRQKAVEALNF